MSLPFDRRKLEGYLKENLKIQLRSGTYAIRQFSVGQSNPTYILDTTQGTSYVMRKKPHGVLLDKAHLIDREFKVLSALSKTDFPCPKPYLYCSDQSIIGTEFYIMEYRSGRKFETPHLEELAPANRNVAYTSMIDTLAKLHSYDYVKLGLIDYGKPNNYISRQIYIWNKNYNAAPNVAKHKEFVSLVKWLTDNIPDENKCRYAIVHGDFKIDNVAFTYQNPPIVTAVFDWELSTIGIPLADLAMLMSIYSNFGVTKGDFAETLLGVGGPKPIGFPEEMDLLRLYCNLTKIEMPSQHEWAYFKVLNLFKMASILQGVYGRSTIGNASSEKANQVGQLIGPIINMALGQTSTIGYVPPTIMDFINLSPKGREMLSRVKQFMVEHVYPNELKILSEIEAPPTRWKEIPTLERLKEKAKSEGLWNLFLPGACGLTQMEYALIAEETGRFPLAPTIFNCNAPDTGNMETLWLYGTANQKARWLVPLLNGEIRSAFAMTEPEVASSDATNMQCTILPDGDDYVVNGHKWWISGVGEKKCKFYLVLGTNDPEGKLPRHRRHSVVIVPADSEGVKIIRPLRVFGFDDAPHGHFEMEFNQVRIPKENIVLGEGRGFEISQGRLGPGRIHHCMRLIGMSERCLTLASQRAVTRTAFKRRIGQHGMAQEAIARCRIEIDQSRLQVLHTAFLIDKAGPKAARKEVSMIKVSVPEMACKVIDRCLQIHGGAGVSQDTPIAAFYSGARSLRIADGPDEVHLTRVAQMELMQQAKL